MFLDHARNRVARVEGVTAKTLSEKSVRIAFVVEASNGACATEVLVAEPNCDV